ncbi:MAG TPA: ATP-binding protein [Myxococcota bacterium]|jgi:signal transduction histidine kinase|nr:ATP-binding protein [Myxococcota bacterium]
MRFSLRTKLSLAFAAVVVVPVGVTLWRTRDGMSALYKADFETRVAGAADALGEEYAELGRDLDAAVTGLGRNSAEAYNPFDPILLGLAGGGPGDEVRRTFADYVPGLMTAARLDLLTVYDAGGTVLACGHDPGRRGEPDPEGFARARAFEGKPFVARDFVLREGRTDAVLTAQFARRVERYGASVTVVAGRTLDRRFFGRAGAAGAVVTLLDEAGRVIATNAAAGAPPNGWPTGTREIRNPDGKVAARLVVAVDDATLEASLRAVTQTATLVAIVGITVALALALFIAGRITRPLAELSAAARDVAQGKLRTTGLRARPADEIGELVGTFDQMTRDLHESRKELRRAERVAAWREVAQRIAHEIKNPLSPIRTSVESMRKARAKGHPAFGEIFEESTNAVLEEVERLRRIVDEFSRFARMPAPRLEPVDLGELARATAARYENPGGPAVRVEVEPALPRARADREQLTQVLHNLLKNAVEAAPAAGGTVDVRLRAAPGGRAVELRVGDNGPGIPEPARDQLFMPYFTTKAEGTGLGLAICHRIVTEHGGTITLAPGGPGATFVVTVPAS